MQLLGAAQLRARAAELGIRPTKALGQNFVVDANTVRRIVRLAGTGPGDDVAEIGPGLGSLTLGLLGSGARVLAVEVDPSLAAGLAGTVQRHAPEAAGRLTVLAADALTVRDLPHPVSVLVANLPYNVAVPVLLTWLERFDTLHRGLVMVQAEVAERLAAGPGEPAYGVPSVKAAWYAAVSGAGAVPASVFWPVPRVQSALVSFRRRPPPPSSAGRSEVFACIDAAFAQRRKTLRAALAGWAGSAEAAERLLRAAGLDPRTRGGAAATFGSSPSVADRRVSGRMTVRRLSVRRRAGPGEAQPRAACRRPARRRVPRPGHVFHAVALFDDLTRRSGRRAQPDRGRPVRAGRPGRSGQPGAARGPAALRSGPGSIAGARLHLTKHIPVAGGMAGGSADAAAALVACDALWRAGLSRRTCASWRPSSAPTCRSPCSAGPPSAPAGGSG